MNQTLNAPNPTRGRDQARSFLNRLPDRLESSHVEIIFDDDARATSSFIDEAVRAILVDRGAPSLTMRNISPHGREIATDSARHFGVPNRLRFV